jgi:hypothetical protein
MKILYEDCDPDKALDKSLPYTAYLVQYKVDGETHYDVALGKKQVEIFDAYWDKYRENFVNMKQSEGRINPKLWGNKPPETKKRK